MKKRYVKARGWMLTLQQNEDTDDTSNVPPEKLHAIISAFCKKFVFQLERGDKTGNLHYQIALYFLNAISFDTIKNHFEINNLRPKIMKSIMRFKNCYTYCSKEHTRVSGPWTDGPFKIKEANETASNQKIIDNFKAELLEKIQAEQLGVTIEKLRQLKAKYDMK